MNSRETESRSNPLPEPGDRNWGESFAHSLQQQRSRSQELLQAERERVRRMELTMSVLMQQIGKELHTSESQLMRELTQRGEEVVRLNNQLEQQQTQFDQLMTEALALYRPSPEVDEEMARLREALDSTTKQLEQQATELDELRAALAAASDRKAVVTGLDLESAKEVKDLRSEHERLVKKLADAELRLNEYAQVDRSENEDVQRRLEMSVRDLRELKARNAELEQQLARKSAAGPVAVPVPAAGRNDWEAQKQRMLAQLEADNDLQQPEQKQERISIQNLMKATDQITAQKDREICELRNMLEEQSTKIGEVTVGAAAIAGILDQDELICQQRETLKQLEEEWRNKLRSAEVDVSMARAKLAREGAMLDERLQQFEAERAKNSDGDDKKSSNKSGRGKWLSRLGLAGDEK